ncbi:MAG: SPOR domain-containing protein [Gammaproteobacteria bacterium]|nr:SPOR domain-containing protein [Gammaproteobacteria bacterium]
MSEKPGKTLSRDFKHVKRHTPGAQAFSGWIGLCVGLAIGLAVALGVFLHYRNMPAPEPKPAAGKAPASAGAPEEAPAPADTSKGLTFYDDLPRQEVEVPAKDAAKPGAKPGKPALPAGDVILQAGSFKQAAEADKLQAKLAQYGINAKIQRFALEDETWYRVRIGPIATVEELETIRAKLAEAEVEATPVTPTIGEPPP